MQQLVDLRTFCCPALVSSCQPAHPRQRAKSCTTSRHTRAVVRAAAVAAAEESVASGGGGVADLLQGAERVPLAPPGLGLPVEHLEQLPPSSEWHNHPELLQGCAACWGWAGWLPLPHHLCPRSSTLPPQPSGSHNPRPHPGTAAAAVDASRALRRCAWRCCSAVASTPAWRRTCSRPRGMTSPPSTCKSGSRSVGWIDAWMICLFFQSVSPLGQQSGQNPHCSTAYRRPPCRTAAAGGLPQHLGRLPLGGGPGLLRRGVRRAGHRAAGGAAHRGLLAARGAALPGGGAPRAHAQPRRALQQPV